MGSTGLCAESWADTLTHSINASGDTLTVAGQLTYTWVIQSTTESFLNVQHQQWLAVAEIDPSFSGSVTLQTQMSGYFTSTSNADFRGQYDCSTGWSSQSPAGGGDTYDIVTTPSFSIPPSGPATGPFQSGGSNFNFNTSSPAFLETYVGGTWGGPAAPELGLWSFGGYLELVPANGQTYFNMGDTVTLTIDLPYSVTATPVPEPGTLLVVCAGLVTLVRRRRS